MSPEHSGTSYGDALDPSHEVSSSDRGNGAVTFMDLEIPGAPPHVTECLLRWPACLSSLSLTCLADSNYSGLYTVSAIQRLLETQRETLRDIRLGIIPANTGGVPDFSHFKSLESIHLSKWDLFQDQPNRAYEKLSAPALRHLIVNFEAEDHYEESSTDFGPAQVLWLDNYASCQKPVRSHVIDVSFHPPCEEIEDAVWPWVYVEEAAKALARRGVQMTYNEPYASKQDWEVFVHRHRRIES